MTPSASRSQDAPHGKVEAYSLCIRFGARTGCWWEEHQDGGSLQHELDHGSANWGIQAAAEARLWHFLKCPLAFCEIEGSKKEAGVSLFVTPDPTLSKDVPFGVKVAA